MMKYRIAKQIIECDRVCLVWHSYNELIVDECYSSMFYSHIFYRYGHDARELNRVYKVSFRCGGNMDQNGL